MSMNYVSPDKLPEELGKLMAEQFEFANTGEKIMDEEIKTVSRGFFKDAMFRLKRNKAAIAAFWSHINDIIRSFDNIKVMLNYDNRIAIRSQSVKNLYKFVYVCKM